VRWLLDEMLPRALAAKLSGLGHDAVSVQEVGLAGATDEEVFDLAVAEDRLVVTESFADFALLVERHLSSDERCVPVVFVRKSDFSRGGGLVAHLAAHLDEWARQHPEPYLGLHWP
jgi:predicted nuclease of predicted toxin-antitoxin system